MADSSRGFLKNNLVLVAAFALPAVVAALFVLATAIPKWTVPLPQHDLVLKVDDYKQPDVIVDFVPRNGRVEADVRARPRPQDPNQGIPYNQQWTLLLFDQQGKSVATFYGAPPGLHAEAEAKVAGLLR